jgi:hypothetical protein
MLAVAIFGCARYARRRRRHRRRHRRRRHRRRHRRRRHRTDTDDVVVDVTSFLALDVVETNTMIVCARICGSQHRLV